MTLLLSPCFKIAVKRLKKAKSTFLEVDNQMRWIPKISCSLLSGPSEHLRIRAPIQWPYALENAARFPLCWLWARSQRESVPEIAGVRSQFAQSNLGEQARQLWLFAVP